MPNEMKSNQAETICELDNLNAGFDWVVVA